ncbi:MAG: hypothetical protein PHI47_02120 [Sulfuricurvum sp.]|uniref:hypothetical protein n=1 Tax=Sulfuricurvum sp. TaxID=2025608 RepID=UPI00262B0BFA|nr:hypothetical protein [Sulfuricurvum sp.]MDD5158821.1 hypothetical protein [Sulfuricurvum sp.]
MTLMEPEWQRIVAGSGFASAILGVVLVMLKNKIEHKNRLKLGIVLIAVGADMLMLFLRRTPSFDIGFNAMILMGVWGTYYFSLSGEEETRCNPRKLKVLEMKEQRQMLNVEEEKPYLYILTGCFIVKVSIVTFFIGVIASALRTKMGY